MVDKETCPPGNERITDSSVQVCVICAEVHRRIQVRICDSDHFVIQSVGVHSITTFDLNVVHQAKSAITPYR